MFMPKMWSLSALLVGTLVGLSHGRVIEVPHDGPSATNAAIMPRASKIVEQGTITGTSADLLYTHGLATCVGMAATGDPSHANGINKVLSHINPARYVADVNSWVTAVRNSGMTNLEIAVSVVDPSLADPRARQAMEDVNAYTVAHAQSLVPGALNKVIKVTRDSPLDSSSPKGTVKIQENRQIEAEGTTVWGSRP